MKKLLMCAALAVVAVKANAALFVNNNTTCDVSLYVYAHNTAVVTSCYYYIWFKVPPGVSQAYNNIGDFNAPGYIWREASVGPSGYAYNVSTAGGAWDAASIHPYPATPDVGGPGSCGIATSASGSLGAGCPYTMTWTNLGGGNTLVDIN